MRAETTFASTMGEDPYDLLPFGVCVIDRNLDVHVWNSTLSGWTGISKGAASTMNLGERYPQLLARYMSSRLDDVFVAGQNVVLSPALHGNFIPIRLASNDHESEMVQRTQIRPVATGGRRYAMVIIEDVTAQFHQTEKLRRERRELKTSEAQMRKNRHALRKARREAEVANRAKSAFLSNMSHEIRTPLTAILGFTDILLGTVEEKEEIKILETIRRNGAHLLTIINDILDLSKIDSGRFEVEQLTCSPAQLVREVVSLMRVRASEKDVSLDVSFIGDIPAQITTDPTRLRQVLFNLVGNALKFTAAGGVRLTVQLVEKGGGGSQLRFDVADTGVGMTSEQQARLFQPFSQVDTSTTRKFGGTGLGLAISKRLVEMLGGTISVKSELHKGSTFSFTIDTGPLAGVKLLDGTKMALSRGSEKAAAPADVSQDSSDAARRLDYRLLLAEDSPDIQRLISFVLRAAGAEVTAVDNGQSACELALQAVAEGRPFDVILMDMQMPVLDGYSATRKLRADGYDGAIIALTAHAMSGDRQACLDAGCNDYTTKPVDRERLIALVEHYCQSFARKLNRAT